MNWYENMKSALPYRIISCPSSGLFLRIVGKEDHNVINDMPDFRSNKEEPKSRRFNRVMLQQGEPI